MLTSRHHLPDDHPDAGAVMPVASRRRDSAPRAPRPAPPRSAVSRGDGGERGTETLAAIVGTQTVPVAHTLGQLWTAHPDDARGNPLGDGLGSWWPWSRGRRVRRVDDDWGWQTVVRFSSHRDGVRWLSDLGERRGRLVTELMALTLPGALAVLGTRRQIADVIRELDERLSTDLLMPTRPLVAGAATPAWVAEQVQAIEDEITAPGTALHIQRRRDSAERRLTGDQYRALRAHLTDVLTGAGIDPDWVPTLVSAIEAVPVGWLTHPAAGAATSGLRPRRSPPGARRPGGDETAGGGAR